MASRPTFIYKEQRAAILPYTVLLDEPWPYGKVAANAQTLWGARRVAKRWAKTVKADDQVLVEAQR